MREQRTLSRSLVLGALAAAVLFGMPSAIARWASPKRVPVRRLIENAAKYIQERPDDDWGYALLGRIHGLAFVRSTTELGVNRYHGFPTDDFPPQILSRFVYPPPKAAVGLPFVESIKHLTEAVRNYQRANEIQPRLAHYHLGFAYVLDVGADGAGLVDLLPGRRMTVVRKLKDAEIDRLVDELQSRDSLTRTKVKRVLEEKLERAAPILHQHRQHENASVRAVIQELLARYWHERAITQYHAAYKLSIDQDLQRTNRPTRYGLSALVAYEGGNGFLRLVKARGARSEQEEARIADVEAGIAGLEMLPERRRVTPIIFSLRGPKALDALLAERSSVQFDLDGDGVAEPWSWVKPSTAILVWDPDRTGKIDSGCQLFGSVTWWMFFDNGFQALDLLDDDRDGWLAGSELEGLGVWHDGNSNGVSDPGEVASVFEVGIVGLSTRWRFKVGDSFANPDGLRTSDGRSLPIYDWVSASIGGGRTSGFRFQLRSDTFEDTPRKASLDPTR